MGTLPRYTGSIGLAAALALVVAASAPGLTAAQEPSLCDALSLDDLHALGEPRYVASGYSGDTGCYLETAPDQEGKHSVTLLLNAIPLGLTFDEWFESVSSQGGDFPRVSVGDRAAYIDSAAPDSTSVIVGMDDQMLTVMARVADSAEGAGLDEGQYAVGIAGLVVPALGTLAPVRAPDTPDVDSISWATGRQLVGEELESALEGPERELWDLLLAQSGAGFEMAGLRDARARDADSREGLGQYMAMRITGADAKALEPVLLEWLAGLAGDEFELALEAGSVAGTDVTRISVDGQPQGLVYASGDTLYMLTMSDETAAMVLDQLP